MFNVKERSPDSEHSKFAKILNSLRSIDAVRQLPIFVTNAFGQSSCCPIVPIAELAKPCTMEKG